MVMSPNLPQSPPSAAATVLNHFSTRDSSPHITVHVYGFHEQKCFYFPCPHFLVSFSMFTDTAGTEDIDFENEKDFHVEIMF